MTDTSHEPLETKVAFAPGDAAQAEAVHDEMMRAHAAFTESNDARLAEMEARGQADVLLEEKLARINAALDAYEKRLNTLAQRAARLPLAHAAHEEESAAEEHKAAFERYMRAGDASRLQRLEEKALSAGSDADGGYLVHEELERTIGHMLSEVSPIRAVAGHRRISAGVYRKPYAVSRPATGWVSETASRPETAAPQLAELRYPAMELYAMPAATQTLLDDAAVDIGQWLADEIITAFAEQETDAFVNGDGSSRPQGFLSVPTVADSGWSWGKLGFLATGVDGDFPASHPSDVLIDLVYALRSGYRQNAVWVMNRRTQNVIRKFKDANGNYIWQPPASASARPTLMGFPVVEVESMPDIAAGAAAIAFGDFRRGYLVVDRSGVRILRDPFTAKPYVLFYTTKRVGGGVQDFAAIKLLKFAA
ncbi:phage major capsid protein [Thermopetrobacter sp. TC1]|uniref:phage major capsid protein n=1 Tax=Thermopetrobacter sp. TC1 TaxID=1495045 RepID=UPI00056F153B|nr:phage major capsid protein [Thermopetrobacter sp. TC1]